MNDHSYLMEFLHEAWRRLKRGVEDKPGAARHFIATIWSEGWPNAHTVMLRQSELTKRSLRSQQGLRSLRPSSCAPAITRTHSFSSAMRGLKWTPSVRM